MRYICGLTKRFWHSGSWNVIHPSNSKEFVSINGCDSGLAETNWGVPPGSLLEPVLFLLYINDLNQAIRVFKVCHFVNDTNLLYLGKSIKKPNKLVNIDLLT